jgi:hypothetical protein
MCDSNAANNAAKGKPGAACDATDPGCPPKPKRPFKCMVQFRPRDDWKGEYGFDWLRIGGAAEKAGEDVYKTEIASGFSGLNAANAYIALKGEYPSGVNAEIASDPEAQKEYFQTYLNLFPKGLTGTPAPPHEAELKVVIAVEDNAPEKIEIEYDDTKIDLDKKALTDTAVGAKRVASDATLKVTCKDVALAGDLEIKVWATLDGEKKLAGKLIVMKNDAASRKKTKIVFVNVKTNINGTVNTGSLSAGEKTFMRSALHQALIEVEFEDGPLLDLSADDDFRIKTVAGTPPTQVYGKFIYKSAGAGDTNFDGGLWEDSPGDAFFTATRQKFLAIAANSKYATGYKFVFAFNEIPYDISNHGQAPIGGGTAAVFNPSGPREDAVLAHEFLHSLGLNHTHDSPSATNKYIFNKNKTDNFMSYRFFGTPKIDCFTTWKRQWPIMKSTL